MQVMGAIEGKDVLVECGMLRLSSSARVQAGEVSLPPGGLEQARGSVLCAKISMGSDNPFANDERLKDALESGVAETAGNAAETNTVMAPTAPSATKTESDKEANKDADKGASEPSAHPSNVRPLPQVASPAPVQPLSGVSFVAMPARSSLEDKRPKPRMQSNPGARSGLRLQQRMKSPILGRRLGSDLARHVRRPPSTLAPWFGRSERLAKAAAYNGGYHFSSGKR